MGKNGDGGEAPRMHGDGDETPRRENADDAEARAAETESVIAAGPGAGRKAGGLALLGIAAVIAAIFHFHFSGAGGDAYLNRLDSDLLAHAELTLASMDPGNRVAVVPSWPLRLYDSLRRDIAVFCAVAALAALCWGWSARARGRRDAFLLYEKNAAELAGIRQRLEQLEKNAGRTDAGMIEKTKGR